MVLLINMAYKGSSEFSAVFFVGQGEEGGGRGR